MIDTHCHLNFKAFEHDWLEVADRAVAAGVDKMMVVGADLDTSRRAVELAQEHPALYAAVGIHPHHAQQIYDSRFTIQELITALRELLKQPRVMAVGEIGLDRHEYTVTRYKEQGTRNIDEIYEIQKILFREQLQLAAEMNKPVILHSRETGEDVLETILKFNIQNSKLLPGVFHCFGGSKKYLKRILEAGFYVGFDGDITYVPDRLAVANEVPLDRLLTETDSPWLTPLPHRGERNEPGNVPLIVRKHAESRGHLEQKLAQATVENAQRLFGL
jgi:TatD DNase family protein